MNHKTIVSSNLEIRTLCAANALTRDLKNLKKGNRYTHEAAEAAGR